MTTTIRKWGNSAAVRIPRHILAQADLCEGTDITIISTQKGEITLRAIRKRKSAKELFEGYDVDYFQTEELDWGVPQGDEVW